MKRKILSIAKKFGCDVFDYKSYKSDMGCQCFDLYIVYNSERYNFDYGYYYGGEVNNLINEFNKFLSDIDKK